MKKSAFQLFVAITCFACSNISKIPADKLFYNGYFHTMDTTLAPTTCVVIRDGKIVFTGTPEEANENYTVKEEVDLNNKHVYPGLHDAHAHFWGYGMTLQQVDLTHAKSWDEVVARCSTYYAVNKPDVLLGRGWDQNLWADKKFPVNTRLNELFGDVPVLLKRVDGHAAIANDALLKVAGINQFTKIKGGEIILNNHKPTGVLIDNAVDLVAEKLPKRSVETYIKALLAAQDTCLSYGLTAITDAGLPTETLLLIDSLCKAGVLKIRLNCMVSIDDSSIDYWLKKGPLLNDNLRIQSFKMYADGALGSRGACLVEKYHDANHHGMIITEHEVMKRYINKLANSPFQLNTHCIGDSANRSILNYYAQALGENNDKRWRIEHAQVIQPSDFSYFKQFNIIPSVQPTHATSDMYWANDRLGDTRIQHAYAYQLLLKQNGWIPLGTDFPVEHVNPMYTLYAATQRKDLTGYPAAGFESENALTLNQTLMGMTYWAAKAAFWEYELGLIQLNFWADFVIYDQDLSAIAPEKIPYIRPSATYISGNLVFKSGKK